MSAIDPAINFFERRAHYQEIIAGERRVCERRQPPPQWMAQERRRLANQARRSEREKLSVPIIILGSDSVSPGGAIRDFGARSLGILVNGPTSFLQDSLVTVMFWNDACSLHVTGFVAHTTVVSGGSARIIGISLGGGDDAVTSGALEVVPHFLHAAKKGKPVQVALKQAVGAALAVNGAPKDEKPSPTALKRGRKFTPDPGWIVEMDHYLEPYRRAIYESLLVQETSMGTLPVNQIRGWNIEFYPFIESFPQFIALNLAKAPDQQSRDFMIDNVRVERRHAQQWIYMAAGFGIERDRLLSAPILPAVEALTHWLWSINSRGSLVEGVAATNYAIEGATQGIASIMVKGFGKYEGRDGVHLDRRAYWWMESHAAYDDLHPIEALEVIKRYAGTQELQRRARHAAQRSLEYLLGALDACYKAYMPPN